MGAWIEIVKYAGQYGNPLSLPSWERGLKYRINSQRSLPCSVAPLVGAWIEINHTRNSRNRHQVAPLVGAWIEILTSPVSKSTDCVAPLVGAWIEISAY